LPLEGTGIIITIKGGEGEEHQWKRIHGRVRRWRMWWRGGSDPVPTSHFLCFIIIIYRVRLPPSPPSLSSTTQRRPLGQHVRNNSTVSAMHVAPKAAASPCFFLTLFFCFSRREWTTTASQRQYSIGNAADIRRTVCCSLPSFSPPSPPLVLSLSSTHTRTYICVCYTAQVLLRVCGSTRSYQVSKQTTQKACSQSELSIIFICVCVSCRYLLF
jgi:hypothetical protein